MKNPKSMIRKVFQISFISLFLFACESDFTPKRKGYNRIDLPQQKYDTLENKYSYSFLVSEEAEVRQHSSPYATKDWIDIEYYDFNADVQITYIPIENKEMFQSLINDAYKLTSKHQIKATAIDRVEMVTDMGHAATIFELEGEVPSQMQFYVTDSSKNFLRGALYFKTATKNDSLAPVIDFIKKDALVLINSLEWKN